MPIVKTTWFTGTLESIVERLQGCGPCINEPCSSCFTYCSFRKGYPEQCSPPACDTTDNNECIKCPYLDPAYGVTGREVYKDK